MAKKPEPVQDPRPEAWARFLAVHAVLVEAIEARLAAARLPPLGWYDVLWELEKAQGKLRMYELAQRVVLSRSNLTRLADRLQKAGLIAREPCADDHRGAYCVLTVQGRALRRRMWPAYSHEIDVLWSSHLTRSEGRTLADALDRIIGAARSR
jgi:DNA-binding MarR family transcriptional regulator